jgi:hypothetical protein
MPIFTTLGAACAKAWGFTSGLITDQYFNLVSLLLPGNGTNGAQNNTFLDSSTNNFTITRNGNTTQGTFSPFSQTGWGNYFNGSNTYLYFGGETGFAFGTGDWTIETFVFLNSTSDQTIIDFRPSSTNGLYPLIHIAGGKFNYYTNSASRIDSDSTVPTNRWCHLVVSRSGGTTRMFVDGVAQVQTYTDSNNYIVGASRPTIAVGGFNLTAVLNGYLSNFRVLKGTGYSSVTVPTSPLTAITNTQLLTCQSNRFVDTNTQTTAKTINISGSPSVTPFSPFSPTSSYSAAAVGGSGYFDGTGDYLSVPYNAALSLGTGDFCVEVYVYKTAASGNDWKLIAGDSATQMFFGDGGSTSSRGLGWGSASAGWTFVSGVLTPVNEWAHICFTRISGVSRIFLNGYMRAYSASNTTNLTLDTSSMRIGTDQGGYALQGYMNGLRITKGSVPTSYQTSATTPSSTSLIFTPPSASLTTTSQGASSPSLLLNYTNAGIYDATSKNDLETVGNAQISTSVKQFGTGSMYFDGTGSWLSVPDRPLFNLGTGDFTIEGWIYPTSSTTGTIVAKRANTSTQGWLQLYYDSTNKIGLVVSFDGSTWGINSVGTINVPLNSWTYFALVRSGSSFKTYINGTQDISANNSGSVYSNTSAMTIGAGSVAGGQTLYGYIDDLRITLRARVITASPTAAFPIL